MYDTPIIKATMLHTLKGLPTLLSIALNNSLFQLKTPEPKIAQLIYFAENKNAAIAIKATPVPRLLIRFTPLLFYNIQQNLVIPFKTSPNRCLVAFSE